MPTYLPPEGSHNSLCAGADRVVLWNSRFRHRCVLTVQGHHKTNCMPNDKIDGHNSLDDAVASLAELECAECTNDKTSVPRHADT